MSKATMKAKRRTVTIPASAIPQGYYAAHVAENGDTPGVLSGAEMKGEAARWGWYSKQRGRVTAALKPYGVTSGLALVGSRWCRVWVTIDAREPVTVVIAEGGAR